MQLRVYAGLQYAATPALVDRKSLQLIINKFRMFTSQQNINKVHEQFITHTDKIISGFSSTSPTQEESCSSIQFNYSQHGKSGRFNARYALSSVRVMLKIRRGQAI